MLLLDQFKSFLAETLASEADGHLSDVYHGSIEANHSCQTNKALLTGIGVSFLRGEFRVRGVMLVLYWLASQETVFILETLVNFTTSPLS